MVIITFLITDVVLQSGTLDRATADKFAKMSKASKGLFISLLNIIIIITR